MPMDKKSMPWISEACQYWKNEQINRQPGATSNSNCLDNKKKWGREVKVQFLSIDKAWER